MPQFVSSLSLPLFTFCSVQFVMLTQPIMVRGLDQRDSYNEDGLTEQGSKYTTGRVLTVTAFSRLVINCS